MLNQNGDYICPLFLPLHLSTHFMFQLVNAEPIRLDALEIKGGLVCNTIDLHVPEPNRPNCKG